MTWERKSFNQRYRMNISGKNRSKKKSVGTNMSDYSSELRKLSEENGYRSLSSKLKSSFLFTLFIISVIFLFYFRLFFFTSPFIEWGNFYTFPLTLQQLIEASSFAHIFWNPFSGDGLPNLFPSTTMINFIFGNYISILLWLILPLSIAVRAYIVISVLFLSFSFFTLTRAFSKNFLARLGTTIFFLLNPAQILFLTSGDFLEMYSLGFLLLALYFIIVERRMKDSPNIYLLISAVFMFFTLGSEQITYLGVALWVIFFVGFTQDMHFKLSKLKQMIYNLIIPLLFSSILMILVFLPFILPAKFGSFISLGPSSSYAQSITELESFSNSFFSTLFLEPWGLSLDTTELSVAKISASFLALWNIILYCVLLFLLAWGFIVKKKTLIMFSSIILVASLLGSGPKSLIPSIPIFLYLHMPGYQLLNASYYWDWIVIAPLYSLILIDIFNYISISERDIFKIYREFPKKSTPSNKYLKRAFKIFLLVIFLVILVVPVVSQGYYNPTGIINRGQYIPQSYYELTAKVDKLTNGTTLGVAFFPPNQELVLTDGSPHFNNPLYNSQSFRTPYISSYGSVPTNISNYFDFLYNEFYNNQTTHIAELMGLAGIKYFIVLKGVEDYNGQYASKNASLLMNYQTGISAICNTTKYTIYKSNYNLHTAFTTNSSGIIIGNYYSLVELANQGANLLGRALFLSSDINANDWKIILNVSNYIMLQDTTDLNILNLLTTNFTNVHTYAYINNSYSESSYPKYPLTKWAYGPNYYVPEIFQSPTAPQNFIFTESNSTVSIPILGSSNHNEAWIQLWFSGYSQNISFFVGGKLIQTVDTHLPGKSEFRLVKLDYLFNNSQTLQVKPSDFTNDSIAAVGDIYLTNGTKLLDNYRYIHNLISSDKLTVLNFSASAMSNTVTKVSNATINPTENGFELLNGVDRFYNVNYPYYSNERSNAILLNSLGGINQVIIPASGKRAIVYTANYQTWIYGSAIQGASIGSYLIALAFRRKYFRFDR